MTTLTRVSLHDLVWSKPLVQVAADLRVQAGELLAICNESDIPVPPPHYWRMVASGSPATRRALPTSKFKRGHIVHLTDRTNSILEQLTQAEADASVSQEAIVERPFEKIEVTDPLAIRIQKSLLRAAKSGEVQTRVDGFEVKIGQRSIDRVANILARIQKAFEERSWTYAGTPSAGIVVDGEQVELQLSEGFESVQHVPTQQELRDHQRYGRPTPQFDSVRSGSLQLSITNATYLGIRQKWADGRRQRIEQIIDRFIEGTKGAAEALKVRRLERQEQERKWAEEQRQRQERERVAAIEKVRGVILRQQASAYDEAQRLRAYIEAVKARADQEHDDQSDVHKWVKWAEEHVRRLDPLSVGLPVLIGDEEAFASRWRYS